MILQMNEFIKNLKTPIAIVGMGRSGDAAKRLLLRAGVSPRDLFTFDGKLASADFNDSTLLFDQANPQTLVVSPGFPLASPWIVDAKKRGVLVTSEISLACSFLESEKIIGVTGSVGKSTTVTLLGAGLEAFSKSFFVGGNLGIPFCEYAIGILEDTRSRADWVVLELSSYQLENCSGLVLDISAITYLTSNHLERYSSISHYYDTKRKIFDHTPLGPLFLNASGGDLISYFDSQIKNSQIKVVTSSDSALAQYHLSQALLIGKHNQDNLAVAATIGLAAGWPATAIEGMKNFKGLAHRLENLGETAGVRFINDSKATAMESVLIATAAATETLAPNGKLILLLGGRDKNLPWEDLNSLQSNLNLKVVFFGECRAVAQQKTNLEGPSLPTLREALEHTRTLLSKNDTLLLSPGGTSLDEFKSFEDRGDFFKRWSADFSIL